MKRALFLALAPALLLAACSTDVGQPCASPTQCSGAICLNDGDTPGGYCSKACPVGVDNQCPSGTVCVDKEKGRCMKACQDNSECRAGYMCKLFKGRMVCAAP